MSSIQNETPSIVFPPGSGTEYLQPPEKAINALGCEALVLFLAFFAKNSQVKRKYRC